MDHPPAGDHGNQHRAWDQFPDAEKQELLHDDADAWNAVTKILLTIVAIGLTLSVITLLLQG